MKKPLILTLFVLTFSLAPAWAETGQELIDNAAALDGKTVEFQGEVVGDVMIRGQKAWINVNDGKRTIGIWIDKHDAENIEYVGDYNHLGDMVKLKGVFHRACVQHGGDLDIHAREFAVAQKGDLIVHPVNSNKIAAAVILFLGVITAALLPGRSKPKS